MPRPTKAYRRTKMQAAIEWKRGDKKEAYKLWEKAAADLHEHTNKKRNKKKKAAAEVAEAAAKAAEAAAKTEAAAAAKTEASSEAAE